MPQIALIALIFFGLALEIAIYFDAALPARARKAALLGTFIFVCLMTLGTFVNVALAALD
jgi:hypothetical protein